MKNKRSTILVAIMVALVGTPKVWQEFGNLLSALQHKTQNKLLSMVLSSQVQETNVEEVSGTVQSEHLASCPASEFKQISDRSSGGSSSHKVKAQRRASLKSVEPLTLAARARTNAGRKESLPASENLLAQAGQNHLTIPGLTSVTSELSTDKSNVTEMIALRQLNTVAPVFIERGAEFIKLKKAVEDNKLIRQKVRCIINRSTAFGLRNADFGMRI